jgi:type I restriction enzyme M protein
VLFFRRGGKTESVMFLHADNDGYKLDANHDTPIEADDLPGLTAAYRDRETKLKSWSERDPKAEWDAPWWFADSAELRANDFNLAASRYRPMSQVQATHQEPRELLAELASIEAEIAEEVEALRMALSEAA